MEDIDLSRITELENHIDDLALEEMINDLEEQAKGYSKAETTTYHQIAKWLRELQKYRKMYPQDRISDDVKKNTKYNVDCKRYRNGTCLSSRCPCYMFSPVAIQDQINTGEEYKKFAREHNIKD